MKKILITGEKSYIGTSVKKYLQEYDRILGEENYQIDTISLRGDEWRNYDFSPYDAIFHVAGIAHADVGKVSEETKQQYYKVNRDLAYDTAKKAADQGVRQFIYMSSVIVYGDSAPVGKRKHITEETPLTPANFYGDSKKQAEELLLSLNQAKFQVAVLRCPMIYGKGSKGNYLLLAKLAKKMPVFPDISNERSMLYVENLAEYVRRLVESGEGGIFFPQNSEYTGTSRMVKEIAKTSGRNIRLMRALNLPVLIAAKVPGKVGGMVNKAFGSLTIDQSLSQKHIAEYQFFSLEESIKRTENGK